MCEPATIVMAIGTAVSALGAVKQGQDQKKMYNAQAQQTLNQAAYKADEVKAQAEKIRKVGKAQQGEATAALAASGVKLGEGSALEVQRTITENTEQDAFSSLLTGKRITASGQEEARLLGKAGDNAMSAGYMSAASTVLQAGAGFAKGGWKSAATGAN